MSAWQLRDFFTQARGRDRGIEPSTLFSPLLLCYFNKLVFLQPHRQMLRTLNNLSNVQEGLFPQNETAQNRICREKSEFDNDSATNTFGIGLRVVPLHDWKSDEGDGVGVLERLFGTVVEFIENSTDTSEQVALVQWDDGTRDVYNATCNGVYDLCIFDMSSLGKWVALLHHVMRGTKLLFKA